jgi:nucleoside 2-deoxyribosyltransferase
VKIYVASSFVNQSEVKQAMATLRSLGHEITMDWTAESEVGKDAQELAAYRVQCAEADFRGVRTADVVMVINHPAIKGGLVEMGMALALKKKVFVAFPGRVSNIFTYISGVEEYESLNETIQAIEEYCQNEEQIQNMFIAKEA